MVIQKSLDHQKSYLNIQKHHFHKKMAKILIVFYLDYAEQCSTVIVTLKNYVLSEQGNLKGIYQISDPINGKQSWISGLNAIWYQQGDWQIGPTDDIGTTFCSMYASDVNGGLDDNDNKWVYWSNNGWDWVDGNEVSIDCTSKNLK